MKVYYSGSGSINFANRNTLLGKTQIVDQDDPLIFMPIDVEDLPVYYNKTYYLRLTGFTDVGYKLCLMVENISVFFDIMVPDDLTSPQFGGVLFDLFGNNELEYKKIEDITGYPLFGFREQPIPYKRVYTNDLNTRKQMITLVRQRGYQTANDDQTNYFRKVARDYNISISNWLVIEKYKLAINDRFATSYVDINHIKPYNGPMTELLIKERCLTMTYDIETYSSANTGDLPIPERITDHIFMLCATFNWAYDDVNTEPIYKICLVDKDVQDQDDIFTVVCDNEANLIKAFGWLVYYTCPDIIIQFNGFQYDDVFIFERAYKYGILRELYNRMSVVPNTKSTDQYIYDRLIVKREIKISPDEKMLSKFIKPVGIIPIDMRVVLKKLYKKEEVTSGSSLNFYLKRSKLDPKVDMPFIKMFRIYESGDPVGLSEVRHYCIMDCALTFKLFSKQMYMATLRENATMSYISIYDEFLCAVSSKIANKIIADGLRRNILCSNISKEKSLTDKFSGAHVFNPEKGLETKRPVIPEDFKSLYPSIIMAFNISPEMFVDNIDYINELHSKGRSTYHIEFDYADQHREGWFVRHDQKDTQWGLIPSILKNLFESRIAIQKAQKVIDRNTTEGEFDYNRLEIKQKAIKVFMNSIYGVSGMDISPLFLLEQAVAITSTGRRLIGEVADLVRERGYFVKYGDTDSVYLRPPDHYFIDVDREYQNGQITKLEYWTKMVEISDQLSELIRDEINTYLLKIVGNDRIKMENEEVKFPVIFTGKKKYAGIAHYHDKTGKLVVDFYPKELFIKGIDIIKEGQPPIAITIGNKILRQIVDVNKPEDKEVLDIVTDVFNNAIEDTQQWSIDDFVQSDAYRPLKDNKTVQKFVARMRERHEQEVNENQKRLAKGESVIEYLYEPPAPGERFKYIVIKQLQYYDIKGKKINLNKGDLIEYVHVVKKLGLELDIGEYLKSKVAGICARFINYHDKFQPPDTSNMTLKEIDEYCQKKAKKFLESIVDRYAAPAIDHYHCKRVYKTIERRVKQKLGTDTFSFLQDLEELKTSDDTDKIKLVLTEIARSRCDQNKIKEYNMKMLESLKIDPSGYDITEDSDIQQKTCKNVFKYYKIIRSVIDKTTKDVERVFDNMQLLEIQKMICSYNTSFEDLVMKGRLGTQDDDIEMLDTDDLYRIDKFKHDFSILQKEFERLYANKQMLEILTKLRNKRIKS